MGDAKILQNMLDWFLFGYYAGDMEPPEKTPTRLQTALPAEILDRLSEAGRWSEEEHVSLGWGAGMPGLERGAVHEWFADEPAAALLSGLARQISERGGRAVWIGRACWAHPGWSDIESSVFVDAPSIRERVWALDLALRCRGVACVIADGSGIDMAASRRLQLAAKLGGTLGLLARPLTDLGELSCARTRWRVTPAPNPHARFFPEPRWTVELLRCKGLQPTHKAQQWTVQYRYETSDVVVVSDVGNRSMETDRPLRLA